MTTECSLRVAEFVLPGHPDKLADGIADAIVQTAHRLEKRALVGVEVALHRNVVFIDGRVACEGAEALDFKEIVRSVFVSAGYGKVFGPSPGRVKLVADLCLGPLLPGEAELREISDDQSIVTGYACSLPGTDGLPVEHALARRLAIALHSVRSEQAGLQLGPDGKLIVFVEESPDGRRFRLAGVSISIQHAAGWSPVEARRAIEDRMRSEIDSFAVNVPGFDAGERFPLTINAAGDFVEGGPHGDNGLSGKKLVADFYGPRVPIGGGAMSGKDLWKVDRAGPLIARNLALAAVQRHGCRECFVTLGICPGDREFRVVRIEAENRQRLDASRLTGLVDLRLASLANRAPVEDLVESARWGHFAPTPGLRLPKPPEPVPRVEKPVSNVRKVADEDIVSAFAQALGRLGSRWNIRGVGHCPRVRLPDATAELAMRGAPGCFERLGGMTTKGFWFPEKIVKFAARRLGLKLYSLCRARRRGAMIACPTSPNGPKKETV